MTTRLLKVKEVATVLSVGYQAALDLVHSGELATVIIPGRRSYRVDERDLLAFIERRREGDRRTEDRGTEDRRDPVTVTETLPKVGPNLGPKGQREPIKTHENKRDQNGPTKPETIVKRLWWKELA